MQRADRHAAPQRVRRPTARARIAALTSRYDAPIPQNLQGDGRRCREWRRRMTRSGAWQPEFAGMSATLAWTFSCSGSGMHPPR
ncbi:hypothetical protein WJ39_19220 [Burkholderia diffusa]|nr:hypothetical protein WJ30_21525 [Burkholderia diffusa]KVH45905.1 hypothetical protein WJ39_19220 [Burkholderia diffusa]